MRICPKCRTTYPAKGRATCATDGTRLVDAREFAEAQADPLLEKIVAGRYHIQERVGTGGMGTVYKASQSGLDRPVALKILKKELAWDQDTVTRFHREAKAMSLLTHPNTVRVFDFGETSDGLLYFAMELLEGELLTSRVERDGAVDVRAAIAIAVQVLGSLHEAHSKSIIHRDLKPDNIFLAQVEGHEAPIVKVLDFGIAKIIQGDRKIDQLETQAGTVFGTPRYMSPEQAQGKSLDARSDLYSVGILLYHMLSGRPPFVDDDAVVVMAKHIREKPDPLRKIAADRPIPPSLAKVVNRAIEKHAEKRFKSATEFTRRLEATLPEVESLMREQREGRTGGFRAFVRDVRGPLAIGTGLIAASVLAFFLIVGGTGGADDIEPVDDELGQAEMGAAGTPGVPTAVDLGEAEDGAEVVADDGQVATVSVDSEPQGAEVWWEGSSLGRTPLATRIQRPTGTRVEVELRLHGHETRRTELVVGGPRPEVTLRPEAPEEPEEAVTVRDHEVAERARAARRARMRTQMAEPSGMQTAMMRSPYDQW